MRRSRGRCSTPITTLTALSIICLSLIAPACRRPARKEKRTTQPTKAPVRINYPGSRAGFVELTRKAARALVHVYTDTEVRGGPADWFPASESAGPPSDWIAER